LALTISCIAKYLLYLAFVLRLLFGTANVLHCKKTYVWRLC